MNWNALPSYQKLFILAIGIMIIYLLLSRISGFFMDETEIPFRKILRFVMGIAFIASAIWLYILPQKHKP